MAYQSAFSNTIAGLLLVSALTGSAAAPSPKRSTPAARPPTRPADFHPGPYGVPIGGRAGQAGRTPLPRKLKVWVIPVASDTYSGVSPTNITETARAIYEVTDPGKIRFLYDLLATDSGPAKYSERYTRVRFQPSNSRSSIYLDREGVVLRGRRTYELGHRAFVKLAFLLDHMSESTDEGAWLRTGRMPKPGTPRKDPTHGPHKMAID